MSEPSSPLQRAKEKALQLKRAVDAAPARAAQLRDAVAVTTGQLRQLRTDVESTVAALRADSEGSLAETLVELDGSIDLLARAGYELTGVDMEQGPAARVIVHLEQLTTARTEPLESLRAECAGQRLTDAILGALIRAEEMEEGIHLSDLAFHGLIVHVGPIPTVRLCWRRPGVRMATPPARAESPIHIPMAAAPPTPGYGSESFFDRTRSKFPAAPAPEIATTPSVDFDAPPTPTPSRVRPQTVSSDPAPAITGDWRKDALARFKKMPDLRR
jgi:hypothetical protein